MAQLTFWYEFASTYTYPTAMRIDALAARAGVALVWRPFLLGPIFKAQGWDDSPFNIYPAKGDYMWRDLARICEAEGLPFAKPDQFPQNGLMAARLATLGLTQGWGAAFSKSVYRAQFAEGKRIDDDGVLETLLQDCGVDAQVAFEGASEESNKARLRQSTEAAVGAKLFGSPSFTTEDGELFWGNDRLEQALAWAKRAGDR